MTQIQHTILVWSLVCAGMLIAVLYSPIGSPYFYASPDYKSEIRKNASIIRTIANAPKTHTISHNSQDESIMPELSATSPIIRSNGNTVSKTNNSNVSFNRSTYFKSYQHINKASTGIGGSPFLAGGRSMNSAGSSAIIMTNGITTLSLTSEMSNPFSKQNATEQTASFDSGSDPGDDGDLGNPIPVGDGWGLLVFLGVFYGFIKWNSK